MRPLLLLLGCLCLFSLAGCQKPRTNYRPFLAHMPQSVLVLPPLNNTANVRASEAFLSSITQPLADRGYYVYPVALVDRLFKDNGVPTSGDMHEVSLRKIDEIIGPDAVMYITIRKWTTTYIVLDSSTIVACSYKLVDTGTGTVIWERDGEFAYSSSQGQSNLIGMMVAAGVHAVVAAAADGKMERDVAVSANYTALWDVHHGLLYGPRSPAFEADQKRIREIIAKEDTRALAKK